MPWQTLQIISFISIQKCEQLKAKNFTSAGEWQKVARTQGLRASRQKENNVNTSFRCAIKSCCDTMVGCQSKRPRLTPLLLTLVSDSPHSSRHQISCTRSMLRTWSMVSIPRKQLKKGRELVNGRRWMWSKGNSFGNLLV